MQTTPYKVGLFLARRQLRRMSRWTTVLIIAVMALTFLNLTVVSGILVGLIEGAIAAVKDQYIGDIAVSPLSGEKHIMRTPAVLSVVRAAPGVRSVSARYNSGGTIEANYKERTDLSSNEDTVSTMISGIDPADENATTDLSRFIVEGSFLEPGDYGDVVLGSLLIKKYFDFESPGFPTLSDVSIGDRVRITVNGTRREMTVKGIVKTKVDEIGRRVFMVDSEFRALAGRDDLAADEIAITLVRGADPLAVKRAIVAGGAADYGKVQTFDEGKPKFLEDLINTFAMLGTAISSIGLVVASITIFIVIFINAITRRKYIGILKGIGIEPRAIEFSYVVQSLVYALVGTAIGLLLLYGFLQPLIDAHPIDFPFSDGILVAPLPGTMLRVLLLLVTTAVAGYLPARMIIRRNTLDAILGR